MALNPAADYLLELQPGGNARPWELKRPYYSVGREGAKINLPDPRVSRRHLAVARVGPDWVAINRSDKRMRVNGWELRQKTLCSGDVIRIGDTWLVFAAGTPLQPLPSLRRMGGKYRDESSASSWAGRAAGGKAKTLGSLDEDEAAAQCSLHTGGQLLATSGGTPLLLGSHPACSVRLTGAGIAAFHCLLTWLSDGPHAGETVVLPPARPLVLGRSGDADLSLVKEARLLPRHLELRLEPSPAIKPTARPIIHARDLGQRRDVVINRQPPVEAATASVGDVIQFGTPERVASTALLLHYDLCLEGW